MRNRNPIMYFHSIHHIIGIPNAYLIESHSFDINTINVCDLSDVGYFYNSHNTNTFFLWAHNTNTSYASIQYVGLGV